MPEGREQPRTPWGAPFAVEGVTASTLLGLTDFLETQMRNFLEGVGGHCPNLLDTPLMQALRDKASLRRETIQLVEAKKRTLESMATANGYSHLAASQAASQAFELPPTAAGHTPPPAITVHVAATPVRHHLPSTTQIYAGATMPGPLITFGFAESAKSEAAALALAGALLPAHHPALVMLKTRHQEEQELGQLLQVLREFSDPDYDDGGGGTDDEDASEAEEEELDSVEDEEAGGTGTNGGSGVKLEDLSSAASDLTVQRH
eukprot:Protomagalhaensia_wolfi_Nauph_80__1783@NODE_210_length_3170_cov_76_220696_g158_i0_p2_GENE_NODE_210_length_3170_cov_76_220696_g158_i0NODE_210_length_3170_cov_76_220696_g158_i0_p2_ORF_typecomplete_len287_score82_64_NODE_210_length_3170_cov_76_220696_g158_i023093094